MKNKNFEEIKKLFTWNQTLVSTVLVILNLIMFLWMQITYGTTTEAVPLVEAGANFAPMIIQSGEWYRLITAAFIHIGAAHLLMNLVVLFFLGIELEPIMGSWRFIILYFVSAIGGNLMSFAFSNSISAGSSTALFGMFAAMLVLSYVYPDNRYLRQRSMSMGFVLLLNVILGMINQGVDNFGHIGGALFGALITLILQTPLKSDIKISHKVIAGAAIIVLAFFFVYYGFTSRGAGLGGIF